MSTLPSSMKVTPTAALIEPGKCQFGNDFVSVPLIQRFPISKTSSVLRFGLPNKDEPLNLSTCACILANAQIDGEDITRPYTPISTNADIGHFDLLIKNYGANAHMSRHMCEVINPGDTVNFKHIDFNVKIQAPFDYEHIIMLVGGTGITPMIQALHAILGAQNGKKTKVTMLYGSRVSDDILGQELLHKWAADYDNFECVDILSEEDESSNWKGERGYIDKERIAKYAPAASSDSKFIFFICGPPPMYNALCGPRNEKEVSGLLKDMGYKNDHVYKF